MGNQWKITKTSVGIFKAGENYEAIQEQKKNI